MIAHRPIGPATYALRTRTPTGACRSNESAVSAATPPTNVARISVTRSAGPSAPVPDRRRPRASAAHVTTPYAIPASHPATPRPTVPARVANRTTWTISPITGPVRTVGTVPP